ncbi:hypothetical protein [Lonepinella sp. MS14437]|uniref:hypothetical protein n=1 Tax=unclassified Lonepinella TaxID=2642006 RepID=UPI0036DDC252
MKMFIKIIPLVIAVFGITSCTPKMMEDFWNGHYSSKKRAEEYDRKEKAYYDKETPEEKELRKKIKQFAMN